MPPSKLLPLIVSLSAGIASAASVNSPVTFHKDVQPILQNRCQECHRPGEIAPFSLLNYKEARPWAKAIKANVLSRNMPPWFADPKFGKFSNDRYLSDAELNTLVAWVDAGAPEGDAKDAPQPRAFGAPGWNIQKPDLVIGMSKPFVVKAKEEIPYQYIVVPSGFTEDKWVQQMEVRPSNRAIVHHVVVFARDPKSRWLREAKPFEPYVPPGGGKDINVFSGGGNEFLLTWAPGVVPESYRPGTAKLIKAGSDLVIQIHYTSLPQDAEDTTKIGLVFAKEKPTLRAYTMAANNVAFRIPPGDPNYKVEAMKSTFSNGLEILSYFPHMHLRGKSMEYRAAYPDGHTEVLMRVPKWHFYWQLDYKLAEPLKLPPGVKIECTAYFDNSPNNTHNPDATQEVRFGEQTWEEMMIGFYQIVMPADTNIRDFMRATDIQMPTKTGL